MARNAKSGAAKPRAAQVKPPRAAPAVVLAPPSAVALERHVLDEILTLQLLVAWAGEALSDPPRLGWWRTMLVDELGGGDLFQRLTPRTWKWALLEAARVAARSVDAEARSHAADGDQLRSLFHFGFAIDEQLDDRLAELKRQTPEPLEALPDLGTTTSAWDAAAFLQKLGALAAPTITGSSVGRRLKGELPADHAVAARMLAAAMSPMSERYPAPHFKVAQ